MRPGFASLLLATTVVTAVLSGCGTHGGTLQPAPPITDPVVFADNFGSAVDFQAFGGSKLDALSVDATEKHAGTASIKVTVPASGDPSGGYAGGAFTTNLARQLSGYNALTFWAKAARAATLDVAGLGNDNTGTSKYEAKSAALSLTTTWTKYVIPIPLSSRLSAERGLFFFAEGPEQGQANTIWFDDVQFDVVPGIARPRPSIATRTLGLDVGSTVTVEGGQVTFDVDGTDRIVQASQGYFSFRSSNTAVVDIVGGEPRVVGVGTAAVTAKLDTVDASGTVIVNATARPDVAAPTPTLPAADVISLFSNAYTNAPVDTWSAGWDQADQSDIRIGNDDVKRYTNVVFAGVEFTSHPIDASQMTTFHADVWAPSGTSWKVKLVDFGADGAFGGGDDREHELTFTAASSPPFVTGAWVAFDIPFSTFAGLTTRAHLAQMIFSGTTRTFYVDNVYLHK